MLDWVDWRLVIVAFVIVVFLWGIGSMAWKRCGNAGDPGACCVCGDKATRHVPTVGRSFCDWLFSRSRRVNGIPWSYQLTHDFGDPRLLCLGCYRPRVRELDTWMDDARAALAKFSRAQRDTVPSLLTTARLPQTTETESQSAPERKPTDSSIELEPIGEQT